jgi:hypothetical protein
MSVLLRKNVLLSRSDGPSCDVSMTLHKHIEAAATHI